MDKIHVESEGTEMPGILLSPDTPVMLPDDLHPVEFKPVAFYCLPNGAIDDKPSFVFVARNPRMTPAVVCQFSLNTLTAALADCGYTLTKTV